jgi:hypothetical protein
MKNTLGNELIAALEDRISVLNAKFVRDDGIHIAFDIAVDGKAIYSTLEWVDADLDPCKRDCHLDVNGEYRHEVRSALGEADIAVYEEASLDARSGVLGDIAEIVHDKLVAAHAELKESVLPELEDWWYIAKRSGDGVYGYGSEHEAVEYRNLLDEREGREVDCWTCSGVKLSEALGVVATKQGFVLADGLVELRDQIDELA